MVWSRKLCLSLGDPNLACFLARRVQWCTPDKQMRDMRKSASHSLGDESRDAWHGGPPAGQKKSRGTLGTFPNFDYSGNMEESQAVLMLASLGHEARLSVFRRLIAAGPDGVPAGALSSALDMPPSTLSHHLSALEHAGLITGRRDGRRLLYAIAPAEIRALLSFLRDDCCGGNPSLCGFAEAAPCR